MTNEVVPQSIIIADHHPLFCHGLKSIIEKKYNECKIVHTNSGTEMLNIIDCLSYDIAFIGSHLEVLNGIEIARIIKEKWPKIKVISLNENNNDYFIHEMHTKGVNGHISKKDSPEELVDAVLKVLDDKFYFSKNLKNVLLEVDYEKAHISHKLSNNPVVLKRYQNIIYLICKNFKTKEIASIVNLSPRTIEKNRLELQRTLNDNGCSGIMQYGYETGILEDEFLFDKFSKYFRLFNYS